MTSRSSLNTWDQARQAQYRSQHPESAFTFHFLLDGSYSMIEHEASLRSAFNMFLGWLKRHAPPMSLVDIRIFGSTIEPKQIQPLGQVQPLRVETYTADRGGTALFDSLGIAATQASGPGQHILTVLTDGQDADSTQWRAGQVRELLMTLQAENGLLAVFLGAFSQALDVATELGFAPGNALVFGVEQMPDAFEKLRRATESYLLASPPARKLLAQSGVFR